MHNVVATLYPCAHCEQSGTCSKGANSQSCALCIKDNELKGRDYTGLPCGVCRGLGKAEPTTERVNKRIPAILALIVVILLLGMVATAMIWDRHFNAILAFAAGAVGSILGFYFSRSGR